MRRRKRECKITETTLRGCVLCSVPFRTHQARKPPQRRWFHVRRPPHTPSTETTQYGCAFVFDTFQVSAHADHGNHLNVGGFHVRRFLWMPSIETTHVEVVFVFDTLPHTLSMETTSVGVVFVFDALPHTPSMETIGGFRVRRPSAAAHAQHGTTRSRCVFVFDAFHTRKPTHMGWFSCYQFLIILNVYMYIICN